MKDARVVCLRSSLSLLVLLALLIPALPAGAQSAGLTVIKDGTGSGTVTSDPPGINCDPTCNASLMDNVTLTATPASGSTFGGWEGCTPVEENTCTVFVPSAGSVEVTATFTRTGPPPDTSGPTISFARLTAETVCPFVAYSPSGGTSGEWAYNFSYTADDKSGVASVELWAKKPSESSFSLVKSSASASGTFKYTDPTWVGEPPGYNHPEKSADGVYLFYAKAKDTKGNTRSSAQVSVYEDCKPPVPVLSIPSIVRTTSIPLTWTATDPGGHLDEAWVCWATDPVAGWAGCQGKTKFMLTDNAFPGIPSAGGTYTLTLGSTPTTCTTSCAPPKDGIYYFRLLARDHPHPSQLNTAVAQSETIKVDVRTKCPENASDPRPAIVGDASAETLIGTSADEILCGQGGNDIIDGGGGNDLIYGGSGDDTLDGSTGNDTIHDSDGANRIYGRDGNDTVSGGSYVDFIFGGPGNDSLNGGAGGDKILGEDGADILVGSTFSDELDGGTGNDTLQGDEHGDKLDGGTGNDIITTGDGANTVVGGDGDDTVTGGAGKDSINVANGNDIVNAGAEDDTVQGGEGADVLNGEAGADDIKGGGGVDAIEGGEGADSVDGGDNPTNVVSSTPGSWGTGPDGAETISGGPGNDTISGGPGRDHINGGDGADSIHGNENPVEKTPGTPSYTLQEEINGGDGADVIHGDAGQDTIFGVEGNDTLSGGAEGDAVYGGAGADILHGDEGVDAVLGGGDPDEVYGDADVDVWLNGGDGNDLVVTGDQSGNPRWTIDVSAVRCFEAPLSKNSWATLRGSTEGGRGDDRIIGSDLDDYIVGGEGNDRVEAGAGDDLVLGNEQSSLPDKCWKPHLQDGADRFIGGPGADTLLSAGNDDHLEGGDGLDTLWAYGGMDRLEGGAGRDTINGGADVDVCPFAREDSFSGCP